MQEEQAGRELPLKVPELTAEEQAETDRAFSRFCDLVFNTTQGDAEEMFNSGIFNGIAIGYAKLALEQMGKPVDLADFEKAMSRAFDRFDAKEAWQRYRRREG